MKQHITKKECPDCSIGNEEYCMRIHPEDEVKGMKQRITTKQLNELSEKGKKKLWKWVSFHGDLTFNKDEHKGAIAHFSLLSIGQLIEYLGEDWHITLFHNVHGDEYEVSYKDELCDALWEPVKEVLNG